MTCVWPKQELNRSYLVNTLIILALLSFYTMILVKIETLTIRYVSILVSNIVCNDMIFKNKYFANNIISLKSNVSLTKYSLHKAVSTCQGMFNMIISISFQKFICIIAHMHLCEWNNCWTLFFLFWNIFCSFVPRLFSILCNSWNVKG